MSDGNQVIDPVLEAIFSLQEMDKIDDDQNRIVAGEIDGELFTPFQASLLFALRAVAFSNLAMLAPGQTIALSEKPPVEKLENAARQAFGGKS